jgi:hypothetical protein
MGMETIKEEDAEESSTPNEDPSKKKIQVIKMWE